MTRFKILLFSLSSCIGSLFAQQMKEPAETIETNKILTIQSIILDEERQLYVSLPAGYDTITSELPVVYVLDAEYKFDIAQSIQSYFSITTKIPPYILIGIANPSQEARQRNYLPKSYGGEAHNFLRFLEEEVFSFAEQSFKANEVRYLAGHSHGGVFAIYSLLNNSELFGGYIAIDPSLKHIYNERDTLLNQDLSEKKLYLASSDVAYGYLEDIAADMQADFAVFKNHLYQTKEKNNLTFEIDHINDDHGNSYIQGFSRGLRYIFSWRFK
ncbi:MAG: alpha/beta hydrolase [Cyclobacteriaceae bacterium]